MLVSLEKAKLFLRVDSDEEDATITHLLETSEDLCLDIARADITTAAEHLPIFQEAILYSVSFMFQHREDADYDSLLKMLRLLLFSVRKQSF
jgi:hypothetical protein